jgi:hypothetical protein
MFHRKITVPLIKTRFSTMVNGKITIVHGQITCLNHFSDVSSFMVKKTYDLYFFRGISILFHPKPIKRAPLRPQRGAARFGRFRHVALEASLPIDRGLGKPGSNGFFLRFTGEI